jgi:hypothetical protein
VYAGCKCDVYNYTGAAAVAAARAQRLPARTSGIASYVSCASEGIARRSVCQRGPPASPGDRADLSLVRSCADFVLQCANQSPLRSRVPLHVLVDGGEVEAQAYGAQIYLLGSLVAFHTPVPAVLQPIGIDHGLLAVD